MRFIDEARIRVAGGHGGPGCVSFRRETFAPRGGPNGGDGGAGGSVVFVASPQLGTLQDFRFKREYAAPAGDHGSGANKAGRDGEDIELRVPIGTIIRDAETAEVLADLAVDGDRWVACKGGRGGKGNAHFVSSTFQAPKFAQPGEEGEAREVALELKLLADAAIVGFPNAGKSSLISRISAARPKVADYAFTTLTPNLGVVVLPDHRTLVVADIPGLIEGAHRGEGLGHRFLKHLERTRVYLHLLDGQAFLEDATAADGDDSSSFEGAIAKLVERYRAIRRELALFNPDLVRKPEMVVLNKLDLLDADAALVERARQALRRAIAIERADPAYGPARPHGSESTGEPWVVSAATGAGIPELLQAVAGFVADARAADPEAVLAAQAQMPDDPRLRR